MPRKSSILAASFCCLLCSLASSAARAVDWSDAILSWRIGNKFAEPFNPLDIRKNIFAFTYASGYKYGTNYFNVDLLQSDSNDPGSLVQRAGAHEAYGLIRSLLDIGKVRGEDMSYGAISGVGITIGYDWNTKNDVSYNSRKRMLVLGPSLMWKTPGFVTTSLLLLHESNAPSGAFPPISEVTSRYTYRLHPMLSVVWAVPLGDRFQFEGFANLIAAKGRDEVGNLTGVETNLDMQVMYDIGAQLGNPKNIFRIGFEYQYWNNKFGNTSSTTGGRGQRASTPMIRADMRF
jgi:nucleoside-specific outer membrane channel protein Tsx